MSFSDLGLPDPLVTTLTNIGYSQPTPIQRETIPHLLSGSDLVGQAQTGTGKTAAFVLPLLATLKSGEKKSPQILVLAPTRELAIQVADSFRQYSPPNSKVTVLPIYGGQDYTTQLTQLKRGCQVIVGTPGRVIDHINRGTLKTGSIRKLVLDEADEMLRMGFLDDVKWILEQLPKRDQTALFSATMPPNIRKVASAYLNNPVAVTIDSKVVTANNVSQRCLLTHGGYSGKIDALSRILETETYDGMLIFVRTKVQTVEIAEKLTSLGYPSAALNGDIQQNHRLRTVENLKAGKINIVVATDVAARGLDVERISHVINFDIPFDTEAYVHRIGRTGRAGRKGSAILFVNPRERSMLRLIERATKQKIATMALPTTEEINRSRVKKFKHEINSVLTCDTSFYQELLQDFVEENDVDFQQVAAALAYISQGNKSMLLSEKKEVKKKEPKKSKKRATDRDFSTKKKQAKNIQLPPEEGLERFRVEAGSSHGVKPANIVGAIANEAELNSKHIGRIAIFDQYSTVDLPYGMPNDILHLLRKARIGSRKMLLKRMKTPSYQPNKPNKKSPRHKSQTPDSPAASR